MNLKKTLIILMFVVIFAFVANKVLKNNNETSPSLIQNTTTEPDANSQVVSKNPKNDNSKPPVELEKSNSVKSRWLPREEVEGLLDPKYVIIEREELFKIQVQLKELEGKASVIEQMALFRLKEHEVRVEYVQSLINSRVKAEYEILKKQINDLIPPNEVGKYEPLRQKIIRTLREAK
jgi:hypothetical protein